LKDLKSCVISWQAARQIEFLVGRSSLGLFTSSLEDAMGIAQHHDAVSGTAKQHTTDDYSKRLALGASKVYNLPYRFSYNALPVCQRNCDVLATLIIQVENGVNTALTCLTSSNRTCVSSTTKFEQVRKYALDFLFFSPMSIRILLIKNTNTFGHISFKVLYYILTLNFYKFLVSSS